MENVKKIRIGILGLGGVGGYFGGLLAKAYSGSQKFEIIFIVRETTAKTIKEKGLKLITPQEQIVVFPDIISSQPNIIGPLDFLICTTKSYDLENSISALKKCITNDTLILPLLNGVDTKERINKIFPSGEVADGCVYIVSRLIEPGVVKETGNIHSLYFGSKTVPLNKLKQLKSLFLNAAIDAYLVDDIEKTIWEKFIFISSIASLTSYLNLTVGEILSNEHHKKLLKHLMQEIKLVADALNILLPENIIESTIKKMEKLPFETTSSMHSDFQKGNRTEFKSLTEYVSLQGKKLGIATPAFDKVEGALKERINNLSNKH